MSWRKDVPSSYSKDREARQRRIKARGHEGIAEKAIGAGALSLKALGCRECVDQRFVNVQGKGRIPCPCCGGGAA